ncbi:MAG: hypothetical protein ACLQM8_19335 [Limisphaerales bacterium]
MARAPVHVTRVRAEALRPRPSAAHGRASEAWGAIGPGAECAWQAGTTKPAASITHERGRAAGAARALLKPACVARASVHVTRVRAKALQLRPSAAHGRASEASGAIGAGAECAWQAGMTKPAASITHERGRAASFLSGAHLRAAAVRSEVTGRAVLFWKVFVPAVHHALTGLLQAGFSLVPFRRAALSVNVGSAEQEADSRAQRTGRF